MNGIVSRGMNDGVRERSGPRWLFVAAVSGAILALDCASKVWARRRLGGFLDAINANGPITIVLRRNWGGAFGLTAGAKLNANLVTFSLLSLVSIAAILWLHARLRPTRAALRWGLSLVLGGALGNLIDRVCFGYVLDFVDVHVLVGGIQRHAPRFNLADVAITAGVGLLASEGLRRRGAGPDPDPASSTSASRPDGGDGGW
jgi:signal peptidase II